MNKIIAGLEDALAHAKGDKSRATRLAAGGTIQGPREKRWPIWAFVLFTAAASAFLWALVLTPWFA